jgi:hypothetical protein
LFAGTLTEKLLTFALGRGVEYYDGAGGAEDRSRGPTGWLSLLVTDPGNRQECAVSDEEIVMIITKKALPRRTFLKGMQATLALPLLDADDSRRDGPGQDAGQTCIEARFRVHPDGVRSRPVDAGWSDTFRAVADPRPLEPIKEQLTVFSNLRLEQSYPGTHDTSNAGS